jgi:nicotinamide mononucleotide (NMN) deamidase PncC
MLLLDEGSRVAVSESLTGFGVHRRIESIGEASGYFPIQLVSYSEPVA